MTKSVFLEKDISKFEYFICNLSNDGEKKVSIPNPVVAGKAFMNTSYIEEISFEKCNRIGEFAFENCKDLKTLVWTKKVTDTSDKCKIDVSCNSCDKVPPFEEISNVNDIKKEENSGKISGIEIADSISELTIQLGAFKNCLRLQTVIFPIVSSKITIEKEAFAGCSELRTVVFYGSWTVDISAEAFLGCTNITFLCAANSPIERYAREHGFRIVNF